MLDKDNLIKSSNEVKKVKFNQEHMTRLEKKFLLSEDQKNGFDVLDEDTADILSTFNWAWHEGDATICHKEYENKDEIINTFRTLCEELNVFFEIVEHSNEYLLDLLPSDVEHIVY